MPALPRAKTRERETEMGKKTKTAAAETTNTAPEASDRVRKATASVPDDVRDQLREMCGAEGEHARDVAAKLSVSMPVLAQVCAGWTVTRGIAAQIILALRDA